MTERLVFPEELDGDKTVRSIRGVFGRMYFNSDIKPVVHSGESTLRMTTAVSSRVEVSKLFEVINPEGCNSAYEEIGGKCTVALRNDIIMTISVLKGSDGVWMANAMIAKNGECHGLTSDAEQILSFAQLIETLAG